MFPAHQNLINISALNYCEAFLQIPIAIGYKDFNGVYLAVTNQFFQIIGLASATEIIGKTDQQLPWATISSTIMEHDQQVLQTGKASQIQEAIISNNNKICLDVKRSPIMDQDGRITGLIINLANLQFEKQINEKKTISYEKHMFSEMPGLIYWKDLNGRYLGANQAFVQAAGLNQIYDLIGKLDQELPWQDTAGQMRHNDFYAIQSGRIVTFEEEASLIKQAPKVFISSKKPLHDSHGKVIGVIGISLEVSELVKIFR